MGAGASTKYAVADDFLKSSSEADILAVLQELPQADQGRIRQAIGSIPQTLSHLAGQPPTDSETRLNASSQAGDSEGVRNAILAGAAVDGGLRAFGKTALMQAAAAGMHEVVALLKELGADLEAKDCNGWTAFHFAAANGRLECLKTLQELGAKKNATTNFKRNALDVVAADLLFNATANDAEDPRLGVVAMLEELGLKHSPQFQLFAWAKDGGELGLRRALEDGANVNFPDMKSATAIARATEYGHTECVKLLHEHGADLNLADADGWAPIHFAASRGNSDCVQLLADLGADLKKVTKYGRNALDLVEEDLLDNEEDAEEYAIQKQKSAQSVNSYHQQRLKAVKVLKDAEVTTSCQWNLLKGSRLGEIDNVKQALKDGASINQADVKGLTAFITAAKYGNIDILKMLKKSSADIEAMDLKGWSALHWASFMGEADALKLVHGMGANVAATTKLKRNALDLCLEKMEVELDDDESAARTDILQFFEGQKLEPSAQMRLWVYAKVGDVAQLKQALDDGADVNLKNLQNKTAAQIAAQNEHEEIISLLVKSGAIFERASMIRESKTEK